MSNNSTGDGIFYLAGQQLNEVDGDDTFAAQLIVAGARWSLGAFLADMRSCFNAPRADGERLDRCLLCAMLGRAVRTCKYHWITW